ncbi:MAG: hypothetical protein AAB612_03785 [Patescibacteria group bacterium]
MKQKSGNTIEYLLKKHLIQGALPSMEKIRRKITISKSIALVYGETYDQYGQTLDSLKYYFFLSLLQRTLEQKGVKVSATVIIGDLHAVKNKIVVDKETLLQEASSKMLFIENINNIYGLCLQPVLMSELFKSEDYQDRLQTIVPIFKKSVDLQDIAKKTVLKNRISQEKKVGFEYTLEEVAVILGFDIKIGPPREVLYDELARILGKSVGRLEFYGIYLRPTYPLGLGFNFFVNHPEIEEFGVTPYKAGSNQLQRNRIILGTTSLKESKQLIQRSFISSNLELPNPVFDVYLVAQMAECFIKKIPFSFKTQTLQEIKALKEIAFQKLKANIYEPLGIQL